MGAELDDRDTDTVLDTYRMRVEAGKVAEFAYAVGDHRPDAADRPAPVTFLATAMHWSRPFDALLDALGTDADHALHARQRYVLRRPLRAGDELSARTRHTRTYERTGRRGGALRFHVLRTDFADPAGEPVARAEATVVHTTVDFATQAAQAAQAAQPPQAAQAAPVTAPPSGAQPWEWGPLTLTDIVRYAGASGDFTALHHDPAVAAGLGLDRVFAMGMLTAGVLGRYAVARFGDGVVTDFDVRFHDKTWLGDPIVCTSDVPPQGEPYLLTARDGSGRLLVTAVARLEPDRPLP